MNIEQMDQRTDKLRTLCDHLAVWPRGGGHKNVLPIRQR